MLISSSNKTLIGDTGNYLFEINEQTLTQYL